MLINLDNQQRIRCFEKQVRFLSNEKVVDESYYLQERHLEKIETHAVNIINTEGKIKLKTNGEPNLWDITCLNSPHSVISSRSNTYANYFIYCQPMDDLIKQKILASLSTAWWSSFYDQHLILSQEFLGKLPASKPLGCDLEVWSYMSWIFLTMTINQVKQRGVEPLYRKWEILEDYGSYIQGYIDMPTYQFSRWLLDFFQIGDFPDYEMQGELYQPIVEHWSNDEALASAIIDILDYHLICFAGVDGRQFKSYAKSQRSFFPEITLDVGWYEMDLIPMDILALRRLRLSLGLSWPMIEHPLITENLYDIFDAVTELLPLPDRKVYQLTSQAMEYLPNNEKIMNYLSTASIYERDPIWGW